MGNQCVRNERKQDPRMINLNLNPYIERNISKLDREDMLNEVQKGVDTTQQDTHDFLNPSIKISTDDFQLIKVIGRGTFGKVFMVRKKDTNQVYAMKVLKKEQIASRNLKVKTKGKHLLR